MYKIIIDSCGELTKAQKASGNYESIPLMLEVGDHHVLDDEDFKQKEFLELMNESSEPPKSACPSPEAYYQAMKDAKDKDIYVITLSANLSGSYNSAMVARSMYLEKNPEANLYVFDSCSASIGQTLIGIRIEELIEEGYAFKDVVEKVNEYISQQDTYFVLDNLDNLIKNGRMSKVKGMIANTLHIKPILGSTDDGNICQIGKSRGTKRALMKMVEIMLEQKGESTLDRNLMISHCNNKEGATYVAGLLKKKATFKSIKILDTRGVSTLYANSGGIIMVI